MTQNYRIFGEKPVEIVVEMGLGACMSEWMPMAKYLGKDYGVMLYERAGINKSRDTGKKRTPVNIVDELYELLKQLEHQKRIILLAHSQGGLYAQQFCRRYPELVKGIILLDPLSARDYVFKEQLTAKEYRQSGVDKSQSFKLMHTLARLKLGFLTKKIIKNAPPFYYYKDYSAEETDDILSCADNPVHAITALEEYICAHQKENIKGLEQKEGFPKIPLILITHSSELAVTESMKFGHNSREFADKVELMWQKLMKEYLEYSERSLWIPAKNSTHYIHLQEPELIKEALIKLREL